MLNARDMFFIALGIVAVGWVWRSADCPES
jgi:hypothetical protein